MAGAGLPSWWALPLLRAPTSSAVRVISSIAAGRFISSIAAAAPGHDLLLLHTSSSKASRGFSSSTSAAPAHATAELLQPRKEPPAPASATAARSRPQPPASSTAAAALVQPQQKQPPVPASATTALGHATATAPGHHLYLLQLSSAATRAYSSSTPSAAQVQPQQKPSPAPASATIPLMKQRTGQPTPAAIRRQLQLAPTRVATSADLITLAKEGRVKEAIQLLRQGAHGNCKAFEELAASCSTPALDEERKDIHHYFLCSGYHNDWGVNNKLIEMYPKCDLLKFSRRTFDQMAYRNLDSWLLMIEVHYNAGEFDEAFWLFKQLKTNHHDLHKTKHLISPVGSSELLQLCRSGKARKALKLLEMGVHANLHAFFEIAAGCRTIAELNLVRGCLQRSKFSHITRINTKIDQMQAKFEQMHANLKNKDGHGHP